MGAPAAKQNDSVVGVDIHIVLVSGRRARAHAAAPVLRQADQRSRRQRQDRWDAGGDGGQHRDQPTAAHPNPAGVSFQNRRPIREP